MSLAHINVILGGQFKPKRHCIWLFIRGRGERSIYNHYLPSEGYTDRRGKRAEGQGVRLYGGETLNGEFYNDPFHNNRFSQRRVRSRKVLRACARAFPATCPFLSEGAKKESFTRRENLYPRLVRQWLTALPPALRSMSVMKRDGAIALSPALLYVFRRDKFFRTSIVFPAR
jgi:hypothetical protein